MLILKCLMYQHEFVSSFISNDPVRQWNTIFRILLDSGNVNSVAFLSLFHKNLSEITDTYGTSDCIGKSLIKLESHSIYLLLGTTESIMTYAGITDVGKNTSSSLSTIHTLHGGIL